MAVLRLFLLIAQHRSTPLENGIERVRYLSELLVVDPRHGVHDDEERQQQGDQIGIGKQPPFQVFLVISLLINWIFKLTPGL